MLHTKVLEVARLVNFASAFGVLASTKHRTLYTRGALQHMMKKIVNNVTSKQCCLSRFAVQIVVSASLRLIKIKNKNCSQPYRSPSFKLEEISQW